MMLDTLPSLPAPVWRTAAALGLFASLGAAHPQGRARAAPDDVSALVEAHVRWLGGAAALDAIDTVSASGTIEVAGMKGQLAAVARRHGDLQRSVDLGAVKTSTTVTPAEAFQVNASGQVEPLPAEQAARMRAEVLEAFALHLGAAERDRLQRLPDETRDGTAFAVLRWQPDGAPARDYLLDSDDGSLAFVRTVDDGKTTWTRPSDWRVVAGVRLPFAQEATSDEPNGNVKIVWQNVEANVPVADGVFAKPRQASKLAEFAGGAASTGWLPMQLYLDRYIYLRGTLQGTETDIVLDSGAGATVVDKALAAELGIRTQGQVTAKGVGGTQPAAFLRDLVIGVGPLKLRGLRGVSIDLSGLTPMLGRAMPVILGKEAFHELVIDVDYPNQRIAFHRREGFVYGGSGRSVPLIAGGDGHRAVELEVEGHKGKFTVDTGSGGTVDVFAHFTQANRLLGGRTPTSQALGGGVGGRIVTTTGTLRSVKLAGYELTEVPAGFPDVDKGAFATKHVDGNLGAGVFARFRLTFDYGRETLHVEPGPKWDTAAFRKDRLGIGAELDGDTLRVRFVAPGSPAAEAGVKVDDRIRALGGEPVHVDGWRAQFLRWADVPAGTEVEWEDGAGVRHRLVTRDFY